MVLVTLISCSDAMLSVLVLVDILDMVLADPVVYAMVSKIVLVDVVVVSKRRWCGCCDLCERALGIEISLWNVEEEEEESEFDASYSYCEFGDIF